VQLHPLYRQQREKPQTARGQRHTHPPIAPVVRHEQQQRYQGVTEKELARLVQATGLGTQKLAQSLLKGAMTKSWIRIKLGKDLMLVCSQPALSRLPHKMIIAINLH
jgi:hypothetical protein